MPILLALLCSIASRKIDFTDLEENVRSASLIAYVEVIAPPQSQNGQPYAAIIRRVIHGTSVTEGDMVLVRSVRDWACQRRIRPYVSGELLLLFLQEEAIEKRSFKLVANHYSEFTVLPGKGIIQGVDSCTDRRQDAEEFEKLVVTLNRVVSMDWVEDVRRTWLEMVQSSSAEETLWFLGRLSDETRCGTVDWRRRFAHSDFNVRASGPSTWAITEVLDDRTATAMLEALSKMRDCTLCTYKPAMTAAGWIHAARSRKARQLSATDASMVTLRSRVAWHVEWHLVGYDERGMKESLELLSR